MPSDYMPVSMETLDDPIVESEIQGISLLPSESNEEPVLPRTMGVFTGASMVIGLMVGSGILSTPALVLGMVGSPGASLLLWLFGAIVTLGGAMAYVEMGVMWPQNGGTQHYLAHAYPKPRALLSYAFIWCILFAARPASIAANAPVFGKFVLFAVFGSPTDNRTQSYEWVSRFIGLIAITFLLVLNSISVKAAQRFHAALTLIKITVLVVICVSGLLGLMGFVEVPEEARKNWSHPFANTNLSVGSTASAMHKVFWGYSGWTNLSYSLGELRDPSKNLPKAATLGVGLVSTLYILANVAFFAVVPINLALESKEILAAEFTYIMFGDFAGRIVLPSLIAISMFGSLSAQIYVGARTAMSAAQSHFLPYSQQISRLHPTYGTPVAALLLNYLVVLLYLFGPPPGDTFDFLIGFVQYPTWFFYGMAVFGCLLLRRTQSSHPKRSFRASKGLAIPFIGTCVFLTIFPFFPPKASRPESNYPYWLSPTMGLLVIVISTLMWYLRMVWWPKRTHQDTSGWYTWLNQ